MSFFPQKAFSIRMALAAVLLLGLPGFLFALPEGEQVAAGAVSFDRALPNTLTVTSASDRAIVNYDSFSIAAQETVRIAQPGANSCMLNRVVGGDPSHIFGQLSSNGQVWLVNPNGVLFGPGSRVDVAGLVASTLNIADADFLKGNNKFFGQGAGSYVVNQGSLTAQPGGYILLLAQAVLNEGLITAELGTVGLAAGEAVTVALDDLSAISVAVEAPVSAEVIGPDGTKMAAAVNNSGTITANGGKVILTARVLNDVFDQAINNSGIVEAGRLANSDGVVELVAEGAEIVNSGDISASRVVVSSPLVKVTNKGNVLAQGSVDYADGGRIIIEAASLLQQGLLSVSAAELGTAGDISISCSGSVVFDEGSVTEARALGIVGNGGRITVNSTGGSTFVGKNARIDVSAGSGAGNGGILELCAFQQLGFFGIFSGRAPPGYLSGKALFDPDTAVVSGSFEGGDITISAWRDIFIVDNVFLGSYTILRLYADHVGIPAESPEYYEWDTTYDPGIGGIYNSGNFVIGPSGQSWSTELHLRAGNAIGTLANPILTDVDFLCAQLNPSFSGGVINIAQQGRSLSLGLVSAPGGFVLLGAPGGIWDGNGEDLNITARDLLIMSGNGIGYIEDPLELAVSNLFAVNAGESYLALTNEGTLNILGIRDSSMGVYIYASGDLNVRYTISADFSIYLAAAYNINISTLADLSTGEGGTVGLEAENGSIQIVNMEQENDLLAYWDFDENFGPYVDDVSDNGYWGYINGNPVWTEGIYGGAYQFDASGDYISLYQNLGLGTSPFTFIVWYKGTQVAPYVGLLGATPGMNFGYTLENHYGYLRSWVNHDTDDGTHFISDGIWHQLALVRNGATGSLYVDGQVDIAGFATSPDSVDTSNAFWIGGWGYTTRLAQGTLDEVRVYTRALSDLELWALAVIPPGDGRIYAQNLQLAAAGTINVQTSGVQSLDIQSGAGNVYLSNYGDMALSAGSFLLSPGQLIDISVHSSLTLSSDILISGNGGSLRLSAEDDIDLNGYSLVALADEGSEVHSADIFLDAGGNIYISGSVYSRAQTSGGEGSASATSGDITLTAGGSIYVDGADIYTSAEAQGEGIASAYAQAGRIYLFAGGSLILLQGEETPNIYSSAAAYADLNAQAYADTVWVEANDIQGQDNNIFSEATAQVFDAGTASSRSEAVTLYTSGPIDLPQAGVYSQAYSTSPDDAWASSGDVSLYAGGGIVLTDGWLVSSSGMYATPNICHLTSGDLLIYSGGAVDLSGSGTGTFVDAEAYTEAYADSGDIYVDAASLLITGSTDLSTRARAVAIEGAIAEAHAGTIDIWCADTLEALGDDWEEGTVSFTSWATAEAYSYALAESGDVLLGTGYGDIRLYACFIGSLAEADVGEGTDTIARSGDMVLSAGGSIDADGVSPNTRATAYGSSAVRAETGDISVLAYGDIDIYSAAAVYAYAYAYGFDDALADSASIEVNSYYGSVYVENGISSEAVADANVSSANSGSVRVSAAEELAFDGSVSSSAEASGGDDAAAFSGEVSVYSGAGLELESLQVYSSASASGENEGSTAVAVAGPVTLSSAAGIALFGQGQMDVFSYYSHASAHAQERADAESGDVALYAYAGPIELWEESIYSYADAQASEGQWAQARAGKVSLDAAASVAVDSGTSVYSSAYAAGASETVADAAGVEVFAGDVLSVASSGEIYCDAVAEDADVATAAAGEVTLFAGNGALIDHSISSYAEAIGFSGAHAYAGGVRLESYGNAEFSEGVDFYSQALAFAVEGDIAEAGSGTVAIQAGQDLVLGSANEVYSLAEAIAADSVVVESGTVYLEAGNLLSADAASIYSQAKLVDDYSSPASMAAHALDVALFAGTIQLDTCDVFSEALASARNDATAVAGAVSLSASSDMEVFNGDACSIRSSAVAYAQNDGIGWYASAASGTVSFYAGGSLWLGSESETPLVVLSQAEAASDTEAYAYAGLVTFETGVGNIDFDYVEVGSEALASSQWVEEEKTAVATTDGVGLFAAGDCTASSARILSSAEAADTGRAEAYAGGVILEVLGSLSMDEGTLNSSALAENCLSAYAESGEVVCSADASVSTGHDVYSQAQAYGENDAQAQSGAVEIAAGLSIAVDALQQIYSSANASAGGEGASARAQSGEVLVQAGEAVELGEESGVFSEATAAANAACTTGSGAVDVEASEALSLNQVFIYSLAESRFEGITQIAVVSSGNVTLASDEGIYLSDSSVYSSASAAALESAEVTSGGVLLVSGGDVELNGESRVFSDAFAEGDSQAEDPVAYASVASGNVTLLSFASVYVDYAATLESVAEVWADSFDLSFGELLVQADGDIAFHSDATAGKIALLADADWDGAGSLSVYGGDGMPVTLVAFEHAFAGANDFLLYEMDGEGEPVFYLDEESSAHLYAPDEGDLTGLSVVSTLEETLIAEQLFARQDYLELVSAGDLMVYTDLSAYEIRLLADADHDGSGILSSFIDYGEGTELVVVPLYAVNHRFSGANDFEVSGERVLSGELFAALLMPYDEEGVLGTLTVESTAGALEVFEPIEREGSGGIELYALGDLTLNAPISASAAPVVLVSREGSIIAGAEIEGPVISAGNNVYLEAGAIVADLEKPLDVMVSGQESSLSLQVFGEDEEGVSAVLTGTTPTGTISLLNEAPGIVYFNNLPSEPEPEPEPQPQPVILEPPAPELSGFILGQVANTLLAKAVPDYSQMGSYQMSSFIGAVYFYQPLTEADLSAFEEVPQESQAFESTENGLEITGNSALMEFFKAIDERRSNMQL